MTATYYSNGQTVDVRTANVLPLHRGTITTGFHGQAAIKVTSSSGIVVERPTYIYDYITASGGWTTGTASTVGATSLGGTNGSDWLFPEGHTADSFQEYLVLANFTSSAVTATVKLEYPGGLTQAHPVQVNGFSQVYFNVNQASAACGRTYRRR